MINILIVSPDHICALHLKCAQNCCMLHLDPQYSLSSGNRQCHLISWPHGYLTKRKMRRLWIWPKFRFSEQMGQAELMDAPEPVAHNLHQRSIHLYCWQANCNLHIYIGHRWASHYSLKPTQSEIRVRIQPLAGILALSNSPGMRIIYTWEPNWISV